MQYIIFYIPVNHNRRDFSFTHSLRLIFRVKSTKREISLDSPRYPTILGSFSLAVRWRFVFFRYGPVARQVNERVMCAREGVACVMAPLVRIFERILH